MAPVTVGNKLTFVTVCAIGMFKIARGYETVAKTIRIPEETAELLEHLACENHLSMNQLINQCIAFAVAHMYPDTDADNQD